MAISVIFQDKNMVIVDKPIGLSVHNNEDPQNLMSVLQKQLSIIKFYPVHRLDKETSGVQIFALNENAAKTISNDFESKSVAKIYTGILRGSLKNPQGVWSRPLTDKSEGRRNPEGSARDRIPCETRFRTLKASKYFTLCEFQLITGRQHQIRKHAAVFNHALVGDQRYGDPAYNQKIAALYKEARMFLHCGRIELQGRSFEAPMPDSFNHLLEEVIHG